MQMKSKYLPIVVFLCLAMGVVLGWLLNFPSPMNRITAQNDYRGKLNKLIDFIENEYVDDVDTDSIVDLTVNNILAELDPHSVYIPPSEQSSEAELMKGDFVGIGVNFYMHNDTVAIINPIKGGPSEKAGIKSGDRILFADNTKLYGRKLPSDSLFSKLKGEVDSKVRLTIFRKSIGKTFKVDVTRDVIPIKSVDAAVMLNSQTAYIKVNRFAETTYDEFREALESLQKKGANSLVLDLRENGGGYMERAIEMADDFLKEKELIVFTKNRKGRVNKMFATDEGIFEKGKLFILIDENSASASEILAGAVQDNDRGIIVGRRSFGKGLVQREMDFNDGSAVRLTVARYYTPSGRSIQKSYSEGTEQYFGDFEKRFENGELYSKDSIKIADTLKFKTKKGRIVYGGGGIVPDIFVPIESEHGQESLAYIMQSGVVGHFVFEQLDKNRKPFSGISYTAFLQKMDKTDEYFNAFREYLSENGVQINVAKNKPMVKRYLTAEFARQLFGDEKYFEITLREDPMVKEVLKQP
ncbi:S41 family peptidase [Flavobacterium longum]|uniref:S41 family peptidase n=1 Tax=Flavobacterium longum TaxID=1299340 RepID=UPI0039E93C71